MSVCVGIYTYVWWGFVYVRDAGCFSNEIKSAVVIFIDAKVFGECEFSYADLL